jgi:hypothetical protein
MESLSNNHANPNWSSSGAQIYGQSGPISPQTPLDPTIERITQLLQGGPNASTTIAVLPPLDSFPNFEGWGILVSIEGIDFDYQFTRDDLHKVFARYGRLSGVDTLSPHFPFGRVWFKSRQDGERAISDLDNKVLNGIHGRLRVSWDPFALQKMLEPDQSSSPSGGLLDSAGVAAGATPQSVRKHTCRFDIGIENDKEFQVARRIIGQKGANMKKIVDASGAKLRLRGKGSGYLEGPLKQESPEPLHLCVSCTTQKGYNDAVQAVSEILESVYTDYRKFRKARRLPEVPELKVSVRETTLGGDRSSTPPEELEYPSSPEPVITLPERRYDSGYWKVPS